MSVQTHLLIGGCSFEIVYLYFKEYSINAAHLLQVYSLLLLVLSLKLWGSDVALERAVDDV